MIHTANVFKSWTLCLSVLIIFSCASKISNNQYNNDMLFSRENLIAWCIVPFDALHRTPEERAQMLGELGFSKMAWDWRNEHLDILEEEIQQLRDHNIELSAVWFWIGNDLTEGMQPQQERIFEILEANQVQTTLWVTFADQFFDQWDQEEKINQAVRNISMLNDKAQKIGCRIALYNHMHWFGEPKNQVEIIEALGSENIGIVYNFHHGHHHIADFEKHLRLMLPYLWTINLNGMNEDGPKILDLGKGEHELSMMQTIKKSGFSGTIGIIGHTQGEDIAPVLARNLEGLEKLVMEIDF
jgi:sugar phosphate isomerase/epimerase